MPILRSRLIVGRATVTIVLSSMIMNSPNATAPSVHHLRFSSFTYRIPSPSRWLERRSSRYVGSLRRRNVLTRLALRCTPENREGSRKDGGLPPDRSSQAKILVGERGKLGFRPRVVNLEEQCAWRWLKSTP